MSSVPKGKSARKLTLNLDYFTKVTSPGGDADRVLIVDQKGETIDGDQIMALIAGRCAKEGRLSRPSIVATVISNLRPERYLRSANLDLDFTVVGDRHVLRHKRAQGYNVGGEQSHQI